jgi:hypothetical protein
LDITERKRAEEALELRVQLELLVATISFTLAQADTIGQGLQQSAEAILQYTGDAFVRIWTLNEKTRKLELEASAGMHTDSYGPYARVALGQFVIGRIAQLGEPYLSNDVPSDPDVGEWHAAGAHSPQPHAGAVDRGMPHSKRPNRPLQQRERLLNWTGRRLLL